ncbi:unnamed protein product, partial [Mesorhabditis belari]|uniref:Uncharacterized protein n=1 Tax=Mesorhabditis belari TaxID=2138241 RepID=A0A915EZR0_9BILA
MSKFRVPTWFWRPRNKPAFPVLKDNYKCFNKLLSPDKAFRFINFLELSLFLGLLLNFLMYSTPKTSHLNDNEVFDRLLQQVLFIGIHIIATTFAIYASYNLKPFVMQIYMLFATPYFSLAISFCAVLFVELTVFIYSDDHKDFDRLLVDLGNVAGKDLNSRVDWLLAWVAFIGAVLIWQLITTFSFYNYIRDRQIEIEERQIVTPNHLQSIDLEKKSFEIYTLPPPPPYVEC